MGQKYPQKTIIVLIYSYYNMKNFLYLMFLIGMLGTLCGMFCCEHLPTQILASVEFFLCAFGLLVTKMLLFNHNNK